MENGWIEQQGMCLMPVPIVTFCRISRAICGKWIALYCRNLMNMLRNHFVQFPKPINYSMQILRTLIVDYLRGSGYCQIPKSYEYRIC
jgi:hypothetical protein